MLERRRRSRTNLLPLQKTEYDIINQSELRFGEQHSHSSDITGLLSFFVCRWRRGQKQLWDKGVSITGDGVEDVAGAGVEGGAVDEHWDRLLR